jgi:hypothetical protein
MHHQFLVLGLLVVTSTSAHAFDVATCGQTVPTHETGVL